MSNIVREKVQQIDELRLGEQLINQDIDLSRGTFLQHPVGPNHR